MAEGHEPPTPGAGYEARDRCALGGREDDMQAGMVETLRRLEAAAEAGG